MHPFFVLSFQENADTRRDRLRATEGRVSCGSAASSVGVEGVTSAWGVQRRQSPPPLASRRLESVADAAATTAATAAAASFNPVVASTQRCVAAKKNAVDAVAPRPLRIYPGPPLVAETSKEDAMEPETKEEDERRSSTPSPEVALFLFIFFHSRIFHFVSGYWENSRLGDGIFIYRTYGTLIHWWITCSLRLKTLVALYIYIYICGAT